MVPNPNPVFLRLSDGRVLGVPAEGKAGTGTAMFGPGTPTGTATSRSSRRSRSRPVTKPPVGQAARGQAAGGEATHCEAAGGHGEAGDDDSTDRYGDGKQAARHDEQAARRYDGGAGHHDHRGMIG